MSVPEIEPAELAAERSKREWCVLDVREDWERDIARLDGSLDIPLGLLPMRVGELPADRPIAVLCHSGMRSARATAFLIQNGLSGIYNIVGGIDRWSIDVDPGVPRY